MVTETIEEIPLASLILDYSIFPRNTIDSENIRSIVRFLENGGVLPPIWVDRATMKIVDGFHRYKASERHFGFDSKIKVEFHDYPNEQEMFSESIRLNAFHGKRISTYDLSIIAVKAQELGIAREAIPSLIGITRDKFEDLTRDRIATNVSRDVVVLKRSVSHMANQILTEDQTTVNQHLSGWSPSFHARQLIMMLQNNMVNLDDETITILRQLREILNPI